MTEPKYDPQTGKLIAGTGDQEQEDKTDYKTLYQQTKALYETAQAKIAELSDVTKHKAYTTLQGQLQKKDELLIAAQTQLGEMTKQYDPLKANFDKLTGEHKTLQETMEELEITKDALTVKSARASLIMGKFPQLAAFEAEGLLPETGTEDDPAKMEEIFGKFAGKLTSIQQQAGKSAKEEFASGGVGKAAGSGGGDADVKGASAAAALKAANDAVLKGDAKGYKENYDKYLELSKAKT